MQDIELLMAKAERLQIELHETQRAICEAVQEMATSSAALALSSAAKALRKASVAEGLRPETRTQIRSSRRLVEATLGWEAA